MKKHSKLANQTARCLKKSVPHRTVGGLNAGHVNKTPIEYESYNERNTIALLSLCHDVSQVKSQPIVVNYTDDHGNPRRHIPDFEVVGDDVLYLEVKAIEDLLLAKNISKYSRIGKEYFRQNLDLRFLTNIQLEAQPLFSSVKLLFRYLNQQVPSEHVAFCQNILNSGALPITIFMEASKLRLENVYTLIAKQHITFDLTKPLSKQSHISLPNCPYGGINLDAVLCSTRYGDLLQKLALGHQPTDQSLLATAKNWRQSNNHADVWSIVGGFAELLPLRDASASGFLRGPKLRRAFAPGYYHPQITD